MTDTLEQISGLLHEAGETHHRVFRIVDGADDDWASWYAQWLIDRPIGVAGPAGYYSRGFTVGSRLGLVSSC